MRNDNQRNKKIFLKEVDYKINNNRKRFWKCKNNSRRTQITLKVLEERRLKVKEKQEEFEKQWLEIIEKEDSIKAKYNFKEAC